MGSRYSRRDLLHMGGRLAMTIGAAKILITLPGCGDDDSGSGTRDGGPLPDVSPDGGGYGYATLDDCHAFGTYDYVITNAGYAYHYYYEGAYGCPGYVYPYVGSLTCYPDTEDRAPGYAYFCYVSHYDYVQYP
jgi:hypothetical protein